MADKESLEFGGVLETGGVADYLEALARGLRDGRVLVESGDKSLNLEVPGEVSLEFEAKSTPEKGKTSIELSLSWRRVEPVKEEAPVSLLIASGVGAEEKHSSPYDSSSVGLGDDGDAEDKAGAISAPKRQRASR